MPKKMKKGKEKKAKKKLFINEMETLSYEQQILDNNRQLARLKSRNAELETEMVKMKEKYSQLEEDRADVVAHLKRVLNQRTNEAQELHENLVAVDQRRKEEQEAFRKREESMEREFMLMESNLTAEVKLAEGKLASLEEWRLARLDLMKKFEEQEKQMLEQEKRNKESLYETEKELILKKAKMQKEMEEHLNQLSKKFQETMTIRIADASQRAIQENYSLNREIDNMFKTCRELDLKNQEFKDRDRILRLEASLYKTEAEMALRKILKQNQIIEKLAQNHININKAYGDICKARDLMRGKDFLIENYQKNIEQLQKKIRILEQHIEKTREKEKAISQEYYENCSQMKILKKIMGEAKHCIEEALELKTAASMTGVCTTYDPEIREKFLHSLLDILDNHKPRISSSESSLECPRKLTIENIRYKPGCLGLIPHDIENLDESRVEEIKEKEEESINEIPDCFITDSESSVTSPIEVTSDSHQSV